MFIIGLGLAAVAVFVRLILPISPYDEDTLPWLFFALAFGVAEAGVVRFSVRSQALTVSLAGIPLVVGFYLGDPSGLVLAWLAGTAIVILVRRESAPRSALNLALLALSGSLAIAAFRGIAAALGDDPLAWWFASFAGTGVVALVGAVAITVATALSLDAARPGGLRAVLLVGIGAAAVNTSLGLVVVVFMRSNPGLLWLTLPPAVVAILGYRAFTIQRAREARIEFLYDCAEILAGSSGATDSLVDTDSLVEILSRARNEFRCDVAEILLRPSAAERRPTRTSVGPGSEVVAAVPADADEFDRRQATLPPVDPSARVPRPGRLPALANRLPPRRAIDELIVPLRVDDEVVGMLRVAGHAAGRDTFDGDDMRLLETLGMHTAVALQNSGLVTSLAESLAKVTRLAAAVDASDDAILEVAPDGTIRAWNPAAERLYGYTADEFAGMPAMTFVPPDRLEEATARFGDLMAGGRVLGVQTEVIRKDGARRPVSASVSPISDHAGSVVGIAAIVRDASAQRKAEAALRESDDRFRRVFQDSPIGKAIADDDLRWVAVNEALCRTLERSETELIGQRFDTFVHPDDVEAAYRLVGDAIAAEGAAGFSTQRRYQTPSGRIVWTRVTSRPLPDPTTEGVRWIEVIEDITESHLASERARATEARLHRAVAAFTTVHEPAGVLRAVLPAARDLLDAEFAAIGVLTEDGSSFAEIQFDGIDDDTAAAIGHLPAGHGLMGLALIQTGAVRVRDVADHPASIGSPPGHPVITSFIAVPIEFDGRLIALLWAGNKRTEVEFNADDERVAKALASQAAVALENARVNARALALVGELDLANAELRRASDAKSAFLGTVSHELRSPLHSILVAAELVSDPMFGPLSEDRARDLGATIQGSGRHLLGLIDDMVDLARIEAGRIDLRIVELPLAPLLDEIRLEVAPLARDRGVALDCQCGRDLVLHADPLRLRQVLVNLLANAVKFSEPGGRVWVDVHLTPTAVAIAVHDTGVGIRQEDLVRIFEPFDQVSEVVAPGAGLGLAIARRMVDLHGGRLTVTSVHGTGSTFTVTLPEHGRVPELRTGAGVHRDPQLPLGGPDCTVLVVEDDLTALGLIADVLARSGYAVRTATGIAEAMESFAAGAPSLVLLDMRLGPEDGLDLARRLRADRATHAIPILALSADAMQHDVERVLEAGCNGHVAKPVVARELLGRIHALLDD